MEESGQVFWRFTRLRDSASCPDLLSEDECFGRGHPPVNAGALGAPRAFCTLRNGTAFLARSGETQTLQYSLIIPRQKIPLLQDGDFTIAESGAIISYLAETYGKEGRQNNPVWKTPASTNEMSGISSSPWSWMRLRFTPFGGTAFSNTSTVMLRLPSNPQEHTS